MHTGIADNKVCGFGTTGYLYSSEILCKSPSFSIDFLYWKDGRITVAHRWNYKPPFKGNLV